MSANGRSGVSSRTRSQKRNRSAAQVAHRTHCRSVVIVNGTQQCPRYPEMKEFLMSEEGEKCCPPERLASKQDVSDLLDYLAVLTTSEPSEWDNERSLGLWLSGEIVLDENEQPMLQRMSPSEINGTESEDLPQYAIQYDSATDSFSIQQYHSLAVYRYPNFTSAVPLEDDLTGVKFTFDQVLNVLDYALQEDLINGLLLWTPTFHIDYVEADNYVGRFEAEDEDDE